jgi:hypothetical protein
MLVNEPGFELRWMMWRAMGLADIARRVENKMLDTSWDVMLLKKRGFKTRDDEVVGNIYQALPPAYS